jgi:peptide deformylase
MDTALPYEALQLRYHPDPILRAACETVTSVDEGIRELAREMLASLPRFHGCGLAAPQIGRALQLFVVNVGGERVFINPRIVSASDVRVERLEGCLSFPDLRTAVSRPSSIVIEAIGLDGNPFTIEARGFRAVAVQHEYDHLQGILMIDPH